ncbi:alpha-xylosidase [Solirhodobacter olei]|uniref:alpha-xylosidase n=1 Tax=Solirhodobacter olei TaxID=2493082 RepID=UPI000FD8935A|nr:alpha-xylosidase [Solirhodobacter olei]
MKFSDGNWLVPDNLALLNPVHVHEVRAEGTGLVAIIATRDLKGRGDQLNTGVFLLRLTSPADGIIAVRLEHFRGARQLGPDFALAAGDGHGQIRWTGQEAILETGQLSARLPREGRYRLDFLRDGRRLTGSGLKAAGQARDRDTGAAHVFERLDLDVGEYVYGLGERFTAFVKNGQSVEIWNRDGGTGTDQAYKNIPFFLTSKGWGLLVNNPGRASFEIATEKVSKAQFSVPGEVLEYLVIDGPTPKDVIARYTGLTGRPALPPVWSFGLWLSTSFTTDYDAGVVNGFLDGMQERGIPVQVFHYDCFWMRGLHWTDFEWDPQTFPDPTGQLANIRARGIRTCLWINPYISQLSPLFDEGREKEYLLRRPDGSIWQWDLWQPGMAIVDFTNPGAAEWYCGHLKRLLDMGVDAFKTDFGERIPTDVVWHDGSDPERMHNYYAYLYNRVVFELLQRERGKDAIVFARSAAVGSQQFPVHWGGDCDSNYASMAESLRGGLSLGLCGFGFWSHDIGGFEGTAAAHVYKRWCAFGLLSSHSRLHGSDSYRVPWAFDNEAVEVLRQFTRLKSRLMPYLYAAAVEASRTGVPMMRAMVLEFPEDPGAATLDRQYMLGSSLLVAPVFSEDGTVDVYLPPGRWTHLMTGEEKTGGWHREHHDVFSLPLYVREGTLLPTGAHDNTVDYDFAEGVTVTLYALADGATARCEVAGAHPLTVTASRDGSEILVESEGDAPWHLRIVGHDVVSAEGNATWKDRGWRLMGRDRLLLKPPITSPRGQILVNSTKRA